MTREVIAALVRDDRLWGNPRRCRHARYPFWNPLCRRRMFPAPPTPTPPHKGEGL